LSRAAAAGLGLDEQTVEQAHIAALLHDIGRVGVSARIWEKRGPLTAAESEQVRMHPYHSERILSGSSALAPVARLAGLHHERCDATGYHRGVSAGDQPVAARVIAAADVFSALVSDRPHRGAMVPDQAAEVLRDEARRGLLDPDAVTAVLGAAGHAAGSTPAARPAGLSAREVEVLRLLAAGLSNAKIAAALHISRRTAEHHVQHIYAKIGVSARTGAAMFGLEHGLLSETVPSPARNR
jgi:HD-GYP domain-containing protein (c-di-GMP phosphodiesterase class II)